MGQKIFQEKARMKLISDERDIMVPAQYHNEVLAWCRLNCIDVTAPGGSYDHGVAARIFGVNLWRVRDEHQRVWFSLKWSCCKYKHAL